MRGSNNSVFPSVIPAKATSDVAKAGIQVDYALDPWSRYDRFTRSYQARDDKNSIRESLNRYERKIIYVVLSNYSHYNDVVRLNRLFQNSMSTVHFPHIFRTNPAPSLNRLILYAVWFSIVGLIMFNISADLLITGTEKTLRLNALKKDDAQTIEQLAVYSISVNQTYAQEQFSLAQDRMKNILGQQSAPFDTWRKFVTRRQSLLNDISAWEKLYALYPDYTYTLLKLAVLYREAGIGNKSIYYQAKLRENAPNDPVLVKLTE